MRRTSPLYDTSHAVNRRVSDTVRGATGLLCQVFRALVADLNTAKRGGKLRIRTQLQAAVEAQRNPARLPNAGAKLWPSGHAAALLWLPVLCASSVHEPLHLQGVPESTHGPHHTGQERRDGSLQSQEPRLLRDAVGAADGGESTAAAATSAGLQDCLLHQESEAKQDGRCMRQAGLQVTAASCSTE